MNGGRVALRFVYEPNGHLKRTMCWSLNANDAHAAQAARRAATRALEAHGPDEAALSAAELIIGELLSNAARHASGHVCLEIGSDGANAQITVHDTSPKFALEMRRPSDEFSESGRGLFIISELAQKVAVVPHASLGKRVTVTLDLKIDAQTPAEPSCSSVWLREQDAVCLRPRIALYHPETIKGFTGEAS